MNIKDKRLSAILQKYDGMITNKKDLLGDTDPSGLFYILANRYRYLLDESPERVISPRGVRIRKNVNFIIKKLGKYFLTNPQVFENRNFLKNPTATEILSDPGIQLPDEPVIWTSNHAFKDDTLATILAARRHAYILFGSLPQFFNTFDGITAWLNGVVMTNRKVAASRQTSVSKAVRAMNFGADLMIFPEGVWNKSPNALLLDLWPGIYRIACETGAMIIPVVHYIRDPNNELKPNPIHTVVDDPVRIDNMSEKAALSYVRDILATWLYLMIDVYGKSSRDEALDGATNAVEAWEQQLSKRVKTAQRYDTEIEVSADYCPKWKITPKEVWSTLANTDRIIPDNAEYVAYANILFEEEKKNDFQHRF